jgi:cytoskeletal protein CcmA (bactofilin family)
MFGNSDRDQNWPDSSSAAPAAGSDVRCSVISSDLKIHGDVESGGNLQVDGLIEGDVLARTLTVGQSGQIMGTVKAETMHISGSIKGGIIGSFVKLGDTAVVNCEVAYRTLSVEEGAVLEGRCVRLDQNEAENVVQNASPEKSPQAQTKRGKGKANSKDDEVAAA